MIALSLGDALAIRGMIALSLIWCKPKSCISIEIWVVWWHEPCRTERVAFRPNPVRGGEARGRVVNHRQPGGAFAGPCGAGDPGPGRGRDAGIGLCAEPGGRLPGKCPYQLGRRAGTEHRQFDLRRYRAGPVRRVGAARLRRDPGAVALRLSTGRSYAFSAAVAAPRGD